MWACGPEAATAVQAAMWCTSAGGADAVSAAQRDALAPAASTPNSSMRTDEAYTGDRAPSSGGDASHDAPPALTPAAFERLEFAEKMQTCATLLAALEAHSGGGDPCMSRQRAAAQACGGLLGCEHLATTVCVMFTTLVLHSRAAHDLGATCRPDCERAAIAKRCRAHGCVRLNVRYPVRAI